VRPPEPDHRFAAVHWFAAVRWFALALVVAGLDQWSKHVVRQHLVYGDSIPVTGFFDLVLVFNPGAAFSFLSSASGWQRELFIGIALAASLFMSTLIIRHRERLLFGFALGMILGGAVGNVIDRWMLGAVVDFLHFHVAGYYWPAFNLADSAIFCGAVLLVWDSFADQRARSSRRETAVPPPGESP
jgi:signal peptidase II